MPDAMRSSLHLLILMIACVVLISQKRNRGTDRKRILPQIAQVLGGRVGNRRPEAWLQSLQPLPNTMLFLNG